MAGLLAGLMLRDRVDQIVERQTTLPNNHSAVLRFRSSIVGDVVGCEFKEVSVFKGVVNYLNPVADAMAYSLKNTGVATLRSILTAGESMSARYIAPADLIQRMYKPQENVVQLGSELQFNTKKLSPQAVISTIPMPALMKALKYPPGKDIDWARSYQSGLNIVAELDSVDAYLSLYVPDPQYSFSRISMMGSTLILECPRWSAQEDADPNIKARTLSHGQCSTELIKAVELLGLHPAMIKSWVAKEQAYSKILPIDEGERKRFIMWASQYYNVYSLGRFATWRPGLLLDDVVNDVRVISRLISNPHKVYDHIKG